MKEYEYGLRLQEYEYGLRLWLGASKMWVKVSLGCSWGQILEEEKRYKDSGYTVEIIRREITMWEKVGEGEL